MKDILRNVLITFSSIILLASCASTSHVEFESAGDASEDGLVPTVEAQSYSASVVSSAEKLYGEDPGGQSPIYLDAVKSNPNLANIIIYFEFNSTKLHNEAREMLNHHADFLNETPDIKLHLEGHADKQGTAGYNLALGERRALAVKDALKAYGVSGSQINVISYGEERPALEGDNEEIYSRNRRVEMIYR